MARTTVKVSAKNGLKHGSYRRGPGVETTPSRLAYMSAACGKRCHRCHVLDMTGAKDWAPKVIVDFLVDLAIKN